MRFICRNIFLCIFLTFFFLLSTERTCSLNNCTVAKRIGKGKDATVIFEHFRKPVDPFVQENFLCNTQNSEINPSNSDISNSYGNMQNGNTFTVDTYSRQTEKNSAEIRDTSQEHAHESGLSSMPSDNRESGNGDLLLNLTYLKSILNSISAAFPSQNNIGSSTVITSKLIKDPRLTKREESMGKQNNITGVSDVLPFDKSLDHVNSEINLSSVTTTSASSEVVPNGRTTLSNCLDAPCFKCSLEDSQSQTHNMVSKDYHCSAPYKITMAGQYKDQGSFSFPICLSNVVSEVGSSKHSKGSTQRVQERSNIPLSTNKYSEPHNSYESENTCTKESKSHICQESLSSHLKTVYQVSHKMSTVFPLQQKGCTDEYSQHTGKMRTFIDSEDSFKHRGKQTCWEETDNYFTNKTEICPIDNCISLHQEYKEGNLDSFRENYEKILITEALEMPKSPTSATKDNDELDHLALELESNHTPSIECLSEKHPQHSLKSEDSIHTSFAITQKLMELKLGKTSQNCVNIITDPLQEAKDIPQTEELLIVSSAVETALNNSNCSLTKEYMFFQKRNESDPVSKNIQKDCKETPHVEDEGQHHILLCDGKLNNDMYLNINLKEQGENNKENQNEAKEEDSVSSPENIENVYGSEKQGFHTNIFTNIDERENKNHKVETLSSEEFSTTFNLIWEEKDTATINASLKSEDTVTATKQDAQNTERSAEHLVSTFPDIADPSVSVTSNTVGQVASTAVPTLSRNHEDHQRLQFKEVCCSESLGFDLLLKHKVSDLGIDTGKNKLQDSFHPSVNENSDLQSSELENEIEVESEQCDGVLFQQDTDNHKNDLYEEFEASYEALKARIDWEGLFGSSSEEVEALGSFTRRENSDQHYSKQNSFIYSSIQKNKTEPLHPIQLPDLQITITNVFRPRLSPSDNSLAVKDNYYKHTTESTKPEIDEEREVPAFQIYSQSSGKNSDYPYEYKLGNSMQDSGLVSKSEFSHFSDLSHNIHVNHMSEKPNSESLSTEPSNIAIINDEKKFFSTKSKKTDFTNTKSKNDMESRISKRKPHTSFRDQNVSHKDLRQHEICGKKGKLTSQDSSEHFSSLSQGRIKTFSQSERHIRDVLDILNSEASLCKSRRLSRKLDRAVLHLKKAHRRVHTSLQLIAKVGEKRKGPLPKAYAIICNSFWESCDLEGYNSVSERRYYSIKHFLSKRKYDQQTEKQPLESDNDKSLAQVSKHRSYKTNGDRITKCLSKESMASSVSRSHTTIHMNEFCDQEQHPESQSTSQSEYGSVRNARLSELQYFSGKTGCLLYQDKNLTEEEHTDTKLSNSKYEKLENHSPHNNRKDATKKNNSETNAVRTLVSLSCIKENNEIYSTYKNYDANCITHKKVKTDILISVLESNMKHFLNADIYNQDELFISGYKRNMEVFFPIVQWTTPVRDPLNLTLIARKKYSIPELLPTIPVTDSEKESSKSYLEKERIFNETDVTEHSELDLTSTIEASKSYGKSTLKKLPSIGTSLLLKDNVNSSSKRRIANKDTQVRKIRKIEQTEKAKSSVYKNSIIEGSTVKIEYKNKKNKILKDEFSNENMKTIKSNLISSHPSIKNITPQAISLNNVVSSGLNKERKKERKIKVSNDPQSHCISKPSILRFNHIPILHAYSENSNITILQEKPTSYMSELKEKHCSANHAALIAKLSQILQRADEASSLQILEEETRICRNILPLFVEAFERKQECSLKQILISRELLVEQNLWNNCKHKLKPCAVDTLVELQMVMETIQFIENKKRLLEGEPTFRSLLWYDETLYSELLSRPHGYQLQSNFYPAFQGRLKYNAFFELQNYHNQLVELFAETKRENNSYYAFLKYKRQINECEAIMKHCSDCFDFSLSVPFTCGVNLGDSLGDLETLRKTTLKLIGAQEDSPKVHSYSGKQDHFWIIIEMISSKVNFIKINEEINIKISLYGLEHICFDAAKNLVWKEKRYSLNKTYSQKNKEMLLKINEYAFSKLQKIYDTLSKDLNNEQTSNIELEEDTMIASRKSDYLISLENCTLNNTLLSHPNICCISEILDQAEFADLKKLQELTLRCTDHLEILKKYFQMLQEDSIDNIFITEENVLDVLKNDKRGAVILKPAATETYIEIVMLSETVHFLKNSMAKKLDNQRFRGMLWFDLSLLPELVHCQEKMASFSFLNDNPTECLWKVIETAISELKKDLDIIYKYNEAVNCSYALHLFSRELKELSEIKKLLKKSEYSVSTYIDFVPYIASINYGNTMTELEHNYCQFSMLLKNTMSVPQKDLGKMAHIMKVMKTIEHMKIICAKNAKLTTSFILCQMLHNRRNTLQLKIKEKTNIPVPKLEENINKPNTSRKTSSISECLIKNISNSSKKRPITVDSCEDNVQEKENTTVPSFTFLFVGNITVSHHQCRTTGSHSKNEKEIESSSSNNLKRNLVSPKKVEMQRSLLPLKNQQDTCTSKSESKIDLPNNSSDPSEHLTAQQENINSTKKRNVGFSAPETRSDKKDCSFETCDHKSIDGTFSKDCETSSQKLLKNPPDPTQKISLSNLKPRIEDSLVPNASLLSEPDFQSVRGIHTHLEAKDTVFKHQDNEILNSSIKDCICTSSPETICIEDKIPVLQVNKIQPVKTKSLEKHMKDTLNPSTVPFGASGSSALDVTQTAEFSFSEQDEENPKVIAQKTATYWNELPQSERTPIYNSSEHSFGASYPYYAWCVYHYSSSNGNAITHAYQGVTSYEVQPPPPGVLTTITSTVQNTHSNLLYSQYFTYFAEQTQANTFVPGNGYFQSQMPISYNFQQPVFSQYACHQPLPQASYPYPPNPGVCPEVPWIYAPWQEKPFHPGH
uniref:Testis expressed sequence 15 domain-containing protein n=1 Tax=Castor canadensis TaxID=51338 RepID=A0A8C0WWT5_CASCN